MGLTTTLRRPLAVTVVLGLLLAAAGCGPRTAAPVSGGESQPVPEPAATDQDASPPGPPLPAGPTSPLDGLPADVAKIQRRPIAVMIDNQTDARPQTGLRQAEMVYEIPAEGGITRFMAVFLVNAPVVGPVRSARHYFVQLARELDAVYAHVGESPQAETEMARLGVSRIDDMRGAGGFFRTRDRRPPHNDYLDLARAREWAAARGYEKQDQTPRGPFTFDPDLKPKGRAAARVVVDIPGSSEGYSAAYNYNSTSKTYLRYVMGEPHLDPVDGKQVEVANLVIEYTSIRPIPRDEAGRLDVDVVGGGRALIFTRGVGYEAKWSKTSLSELTRFTDAAGQAVKLAPGLTWIHVVPLEARIDW